MGTSHEAARETTRHSPTRARTEEESEENVVPFASRIRKPDGIDRATTESGTSAQVLRKVLRALHVVISCSPSWQKEQNSSL